MARRPLRDQVLEATAAGEGEGIEPAGKIIIVSRTAGFRRAGIVHPAKAEYPLDFFTQEQLDAFDAEPELEVLVSGGLPEPASEAIAGVGLPFIGDTEI